MSPEACPPNRTLNRRVPSTNSPNEPVLWLRVLAAVDAKVAKLPTTNTFKDPEYLEKVDAYIAQKQSLWGQMQLIEPPFMQATVHNKLLIAMNNGIRYLQSEREKFVIAAEKMRKTVPKAPRGREEYEIIKEYQSQTASYQANIKEQMMKKQYDRLYWEAKDELERISKL